MGIPWVPMPTCPRPMLCSAEPITAIPLPPEIHTAVWAGNVGAGAFACGQTAATQANFVNAQLLMQQQQQALYAQGNIPGIGVPGANFMNRGLINPGLYPSAYGAAGLRYPGNALGINAKFCSRWKQSMGQWKCKWSFR